MTAPIAHSVRVDDIRLQPINTPEQLERVMHLREGIDLSTHSFRENFRALEKKGTTWASWSASS